MINHMRTLLLNKHYTDAGIETDYEYTAYIDHNFSPINLTTELLNYRTIIIPNTTIEKQLVRVTNLMRILHTKELEPYTLYFDSRITYSLTDYSLVNSEHDDFDIEYVYPAMELFWLNPNFRTYLLDTPITWPTKGLNTIVVEADDINLKLGGLILIYCFKSESLRIKNG
ncbi:hypothetical protein ACFLQL_00235 [Verrucomicrobiota bacterium]